MLILLLVCAASSCICAVGKPVTCHLDLALTLVCLERHYLYGKGVLGCLANVTNELTGPPSSLVARAPARTKEQLKVKRLIDARRASGEPLRLNVGCGAEGQEVFRLELCTDQNSLNLFGLDDWQMLFGSIEAVDAMLAEHVLEHFTPQQVRFVAAAAFLFLKPGGRFRIAVPDGYNPSAKYREAARQGKWGSRHVQHHMILWTIETLPPLLSDAGFHVVPQEYFNAGGKFYQAEHAYVNESALGKIHRSEAHDKRNANGSTAGMSLWFDAVKPPRPEAGYPCERERAV